MRLAYSRKLVELTDWAEKIAGTGREAQKRFLTFCVDQVRENYMLNIGQKKNRLVYLMGEEAEFAENFNAFIIDGNVERLNEEFNRAYTHIAANGNAKIVFLDMSLKIVKLKR